MVIKKILSLLIISLFIFSVIPVFVSAASYNSNSTACVEKWECSSWDSCRYGERERECYDLNHCGTTRDKPDEDKACYSYDDHSYGNMNCDPDNYYGRSHPCYDVLRDGRYMGNYFDDYQYEVQKYYQDKYESQPNNNQNDGIQIIQLSYPEDNNYDDKGYKEDKDYSNLENNLPLIITASLLGLLSIIAFVVILVVAARRR
ncbi:MAG: hypothetical protein AABX03_00140 [Nanoarchaeota archaeon]